MLTKEPVSNYTFYTQLRICMHIIAGKYKNRSISAPSGLETRPTSGRLRESVFNICQHNIEGAEFLDLFAGSGIMGLEALSRGAKRATFIDKGRESISAIRRNVQALGVETEATVLQGDAIQRMKKLEEAGMHFDLIYVDPPYGLMDKSDTCSSRVLSELDKGDLLKEGGMLFIEESQEAQPDGEGLTTLHLMSSRRMGRSTLLQYEKRR